MAIRSATVFPGKSGKGNYSDEWYTPPYIVAALGPFDGGPIAAQRYAIIPHGSTPGSLWRDVLQPLGIHLLAEVLIDLDHGFHPSAPQAHSLATFCDVAA